MPNPVFLTYDSANGNIYAANHDTQLVSVIDSSSNTVIATLTVGPDPTGVGFDQDNGVIYVGNQGANYVSLQHWITSAFHPCVRNSDCHVV